MSDLSHLVIDEADTLFDSSFEEAVSSIIKGIKVRQPHIYLHEQCSNPLCLLLFNKVRDKKPDLPPALGEDAQVTIVGATLSGKMLKKISSLIPVSSC